MQNEAAPLTRPRLAPADARDNAEILRSTLRFCAEALRLQQEVARKLQNQLADKQQLLKALQSARMVQSAAGARQQSAGRPQKPQRPAQQPQKAVKQPQRPPNQLAQNGDPEALDAQPFVRIQKQPNALANVLLCALANVPELLPLIDAKYAGQIVVRDGCASYSVPQPAKLFHICDHLEFLFSPIEAKIAHESSIQQSSSYIYEALVSICRAHKDQKLISYRRSYFLSVCKVEQRRTDLLALMRQRYRQENGGALQCCKEGRKSRKLFIAGLPRLLIVRIDGNQNAKSAASNAVDVPAVLDLSEFVYRPAAAEPPKEYRLVGYAFKSGASFYGFSVEKQRKAYVCSNGEVRTRRALDERQLGVQVCFYRAIGGAE